MEPLPPPGARGRAVCLLVTFMMICCTPHGWIQAKLWLSVRRVRRRRSSLSRTRILHFLKLRGGNLRARSSEGLELETWLAPVCNGIKDMATNGSISAPSKKQLRIAVQVPPQLLHLSSQISTHLQSSLSLPSRNIEKIILFVGNGCCLDEMSVSKLNPNLVLQIGNHCNPNLTTSVTTGIPVIHTDGRSDLDIRHLVSAINYTISPKLTQNVSLTLIVDRPYLWAKEEILLQWGAMGRYDVSMRIREPTHTSKLDQDISTEGHEHSKSVVIYVTDHVRPEGSYLAGRIGELSEKGESQVVRHEVLSRYALKSRQFWGAKVYLYAGAGNATQSLIEISENLRQLAISKRFARMQSAKDAEHIGVLLADPALSLTHPEVVGVLETLKRKKVRHHIFSTSKVNPNMLGNFLSVEAWVVFACPEITIKIVTSTQFDKAMITPYELKVAMGECSWSG
ncbi:hypothetical protein AAMO2058_000426300 [Amorphochlora amoebiformis]